LNNDSRDDLICHDVANGDTWALFAQPGGTFDYGQGHSWFLPLGWCSQSSDRMMVGDVTGDRRADLICHNKASGDIRILPANSAGKFLAATEVVSSDLGWCIEGSGVSSQIETGDYDGDGYADVLCHMKSASKSITWILYGASNGSFSLSRSWNTSSTTNWCSGANDQLLAAGRPLGFAPAPGGDFNFDGSTDLLCHNKSSGTMDIAFANFSYLK